MEELSELDNEVISKLFKPFSCIGFVMRFREISDFEWEFIDLFCLLGLGLVIGLF